jgi:hypothetical protein
LGGFPKSNQLPTSPKPFKDFAMFFKKKPAPGASPSEPEIEPASSKHEPIDTTKRYDVYCSHLGLEIVIYRNVRFRGRRPLISKEKFDIASHFLELEDPNGQSVYVGLFSVQKFCLHGVEFPAERIPAQKPQ